MRSSQGILDKSVLVTRQGDHPGMAGRWPRRPQHSAAKNKKPLCGLRPEVVSDEYARSSTFACAVDRIPVAEFDHFLDKKSEKTRVDAGKIFKISEKL